MSKSIYDEHYKKENYFGEPYPGLQKFFQGYHPKGKVLDLGCGQGRDALYLGRLGYKVKGIDISKVGINQMNNVASSENLPVRGEVADVYTYPISDEYDVIILDSMIHFYKNDFNKETAFVLRAASELRVGGLLCNFMIKGAKREKHLKNVINNIGVKWEVIYEGYTNYPESNSQFHMYFIKKM